MNLKKILLAGFVLFMAAKGYAQHVAINTDGSAADSSAILDVQSVNKGMLTPRMTQVQREAILKPANGLLVYQTDGTAGFYFYSGGETAWKMLNTGSTATAPKAGSIIPFASGTPVVLTSLAGGLVGTAAFLGFGNNSSYNGPTNPIDLTGATGLDLNKAFVVPRDIVITDLGATFSLTTALSAVGSTLDIQAQLYMSAPGGGNIFTLVPGALVPLSPSLTGVLSIGTFISANQTGLNISVPAGSRLLLVFNMSTSGVFLATTIEGYASAGLGFE